MSISLPLQEEAFTPDETKNYFDGLLPEGFTRHSVAEWMKIDDNDYISLLHNLGCECLGAVRISSAEEESEAGYEKLSLNQVKKLAAEGAVKSSEMVVKY